MPTEATGSPQEPPKRRGRPKGSVNKNKASNERPELPGAPPWNFEPDTVKVKLASEHAVDGLDAVVKTFIIVGVSALPNGMASIITNIGVQQPFILVTAEPYSDVVARLFPGVK